MKYDILRAEVKANQDKLEACKNHVFRPITPGLFGTKYACDHCAGIVDGLSAKWYEVGKLHATSGKSGQ